MPDGAGQLGVLVLDVVAVSEDEGNDVAKASLEPALVVAIDEAGSLPLTAPENVVDTADADVAPALELDGTENETALELDSVEDVTALELEEAVILAKEAAVEVPEVVEEALLPRLGIGAVPVATPSCRMAPKTALLGTMPVSDFFK